MDTKADRTKNEILQCACREFVSAGYHGAAMRDIAAAAGVTTGAVYRYFPDKDALFCAVTADATALFNGTYGDMVDQALREADEGIAYDRSETAGNLQLLYELIYTQFDQFYLLLLYSGETSLGSFLQRFVEWETELTVDYVERLRAQWQSSYTMDRTTAHILVEGYVTSLFEPVRHRMPKEEALALITELEAFFVDGWMGIERRIRESGNQA